MGWKWLKPPSETSYGIIPWLTKLDEWWGWHWMTVMGLLLQLLLVVCYPPLEKRDDHWSSICENPGGAETWPQLLVIVVVIAGSVSETDWLGGMGLDGLEMMNFGRYLGIQSVGRSPKIRMLWWKILRVKSRSAPRETMRSSRAGEAQWSIFEFRKKKNISIVTLFTFHVWYCSVCQSADSYTYSMIRKRRLEFS